MLKKRIFLPLAMIAMLLLSMLPAVVPASAATDSNQQLASGADNSIGVSDSVYSGSGSVADSINSRSTSVSDNSSSSSVSDSVYNLDDSSSSSVTDSTNSSSSSVTDSVYVSNGVTTDDALNIAASSASLSDGTVYVPYTSEAITNYVCASDGSGTYSFSVDSSTLPIGLSFGNNVISGTPGDIGMYNVAVTVTDSNNDTPASITLFLQIDFPGSDDRS
jgi:type II secretory pathway pseudopilin PulG